MNIADFPSAAMEILKAGLDRYPAGVGGDRLRRKGINPAHLSARGAIAEARLGLGDLNIFLSTQGEAMDAFFTRLRVLLFAGDTPIGSAGLFRADSGDFEVEHVTLGGVEEIVVGLRDMEDFPESVNSEVRLIQVPQIYLSSLALVLNGELRRYYILTPPYQDAAAARTPAAFRGFASRLLEEHQAVFRPV
jgi:hypothetical protein